MVMMNEEDDPIAQPDEELDEGNDDAEMVDHDDGSPDEDGDEYTPDDNDERTESSDTYEVVDYEYITPTDPEGEEKIDDNGQLLGGRQFMMRTFKIVGGGDKLFMQATEPARLFGYNNSHFFFQAHPALYKVVLSQEQKNDLVDRRMLPHTYRNRKVLLVAARSVFKEFGAKVVLDGKNITDDYQVAMQRSLGVEEGSSPRSTRQRKQSSVRPDDVSQQVTPQPTQTRRRNELDPVTPAEGMATKLSQSNWLYHHAAASSRFNSDMYYDRVRLLLIEQQGIRDPYTNVLHLPKGTQPTRVCKRYKLDSKKDSSQIIACQSRLQSSDLLRSKTGLNKVNVEIYTDVVSDDVRQAIERQRAFEDSSCF